jgi:hypothetical protein
MQLRGVEIELLCCAAASVMLYIVLYFPGGHFSHWALPPTKKFSKYSPGAQFGSALATSETSCDPLGV